MDRYYQDIFTEPADVDADTLRNLGPLRPMAGVWRGTRGLDVNPKADGPQTQAYIDHIELHPIDPQTNGPQLLYGLRYHQHIVKPGEVETYHDQIGYWLWEPATQTIMQTLAIPRGQIAMAAGRAAPDARTFEIEAKRGETHYGICANPFLDEAFRTESWRVRITIDDDGGWSYEQVTTLRIRGAAEPFLHTDRSSLVKIGEPTPNPLMRN
ncbi:MAG: FABP family protein [Methylocystis sp.]|uniref:FABP family protein n=1 Tax=Methylocystis sp. TaxID=1911079 RepID=UPI003DA54CB4